MLEAARAAGMSAHAAYALRNRDPLFDAGWEAALTLARRRLAMRGRSERRQAGEVKSAQLDLLRPRQLCQAPAVAEQTSNKLLSYSSPDRLSQVA